MRTGKAKITHMYHSGFVVETRNHILIFDYITNKNIGNMSLMDDFIGKEKEVFVFVTHGHKDHFDPVILTWVEYNPNIKYIISDDIFIDTHNQNLYFVEKYNSLKFDNITIETYGTTDRGLSYLVKVDDLNIYHSGDLNWWHWKSDNENTQKKEEVDYKREVDLLKGKDIDIAFVPADPRLDEYYYLAGEYFAKTISPGLLIPMHFGDKIEISHKFSEKINYLDTKVWRINGSLDQYNYVDKKTGNS
ncbi:MBL fold metallo-hydrolase [Clostridium sp. D2Q-11]|uniref:MBL fold metallo-hydrolase n=1 Tax=Anaeromonas frigoriresistens TaxID=2683708 RepID=A0A942V095_9FIRM|nr:MBL fold metallo-hydrolase [Anaeromonas frigoriresistens]MBS4539521.1 MBL fold metallo-hydrolase [Anaeromonas frigoriresistens]